MGTSRWDPDDWDSYVASSSKKSARELFSKKLHKDLDPLNVKFRESCDSDLNPLSTPIIVAVDNTGSMGFLAENLIRKGLGVLVEEIYLRKPVTDPHVMCMAVGDSWYDSAPLQVTQFEADIRLVDQLSKFWIEGGGGGNSYESYNLPWYFAATRTKCDAILKRKKKGYLFTVGDEPPAPKLVAAHARKYLGDGLQADLSTEDILAMASKSWEIFHIIIKQGSYCQGHLLEVRNKWQKLLGQRAIVLDDANNLSELIVSTMQVNEGEDLAAVASTWSGGTAVAVRNSLKGLRTAVGAGGKGVTRF